MKRMILRRLILFFFFFCILSSVFCILNPAYSEVPRLINYQGRLTDSGGKPLDGTYKLNFKIYNSAGTLLWQGTHNSVLVQKGVFSVLLGDANDAPYNFAQLAFDEPYFLEIKVCKIEGANETCEVLSPRQQITSSAYAIRAEKAEDANTVANVGVSTTPQANKILPLDGNAKIPAQALGFKVYDSGWFAVGLNANYTKIHNLGTTKVIIQLWFSPNSDGSSPTFLVNHQFDMDQDGRGSYINGCINGLTTTTVSLSTPGTGFYQWVAEGLVNATTVGQYTSGYYRIIMLGLE